MLQNKACGLYRRLYLWFSQVFECGYASLEGEREEEENATPSAPKFSSWTYLQHDILQVAIVVMLCVVCVDCVSVVGVLS